MLLEWLFWACVIMVTLAIDNVYWIPGSPEWTNAEWKARPLRWKLWWAFRWRFVHVLLNPVDWAAALTGGLLVAFLI